MNQQFDNMNIDHDLKAESNTSLQTLHDAQPTLRESIPKAFLNCPATRTRPRHKHFTNNQTIHTSSSYPSHCEIELKTIDIHLSFTKYIEALAT